MTNLAKTLAATYILVALAGTAAATLPNPGNTVENIDSLFEAAKASDMPVFVSPHYYYPTDHGWQAEGALETLMHNIGMFDRKGALTTEDFEGSGADWLVNFRFIANTVWTTEQAVQKINGGK